VSVIAEFSRREAVLSAAPPGESVDRQLVALRQRQHDHPLWSCRLVKAFAQGELSREDLRYVFSQYHLYTSSFTRLLAAVMVSCESDLFRAALSENLWEEGGGCEPERRHAQIFRRFLRGALGVDDVDHIEYASCTRQFVCGYLAAVQHAEPMAAAAFLALGTEGIVSRMYAIMRTGLARAGIPDAELEFFDIHIACDDNHAVTLERLMRSYAGLPGWFEACAGAIDHALGLRATFFDDLLDNLQARRLRPLIHRMHARESLARGVDDAALVHRPGNDRVTMYANQVDKLDIQFTVERLPLEAEVLDPRVVRIPPGRRNEKHKHAHETLIHLLDGDGQVVVDDRVFPVRGGDTVLVPRWAVHQTHNLGTTELRFLAVTDFRLSERAYIGDPTDYRMNADIDAERRRHS
jgi:quercetin dioxygenase-like cupin family protein/pyrroloquinoline quinone (PQQ) biosynthesis protein C